MRKAANRSDVIFINRKPPLLKGSNGKSLPLEASYEIANRGLCSVCLVELRFGFISGEQRLHFDLSQEQEGRVAAGELRLLDHCTVKAPRENWRGRVNKLTERVGEGEVGDSQPVGEVGGGLDGIILASQTSHGHLRSAAGQ